ncbi:hypothetical protein Sden_2635 [Shewanella denitrificans OS217]|uniref:DUF2892 domain-containing protein n=1 Tax=Shewanella denitrificans (strain OS217 / ATCC BAA-1090 / DSM 15013) TaxID=318161 RepID=Q12KW2_SHEDO|nr:hypothetical protein [Shewanella denitrificans]ABE55914.1 hypothetical protein Sden_2635 [Shewanella denitrificans OS217]
MLDKSLFASSSLTEHLVRGILGLALLWLAIDIAAEQPWASLGLGVLMIIAFKGCPVCWTIGLFETLYLKWTQLKNRFKTSTLLP